MKLLFLVPSFHTQYSNCISLNKRKECTLENTNSDLLIIHINQLHSQIHKQNFSLEKEKTHQKKCYIELRFKYARHAGVKKQAEITYTYLSLQLSSTALRVVLYQKLSTSEFDFLFLSSTLISYSYRKLLEMNLLLTSSSSLSFC